MKKIYFGRLLVVVSLGFFSIPLLALSAGGGGGGGGSETPPPPSCTADIWTCTDWGNCSPEGKQTRFCTLSFNCPTTETPKPAETQSCQPPVAPTPAPTLAPEPSKQPITIPSPEIKTPVAKIPTTKKTVCSESELNCGEWSQCKENGRQIRTCKVAKACANAPKPKLEQDQVCVGLKCGQLDSIKERVSCRLQLTPAEMKQEFSILYFPEYCKVEGGWADKKECLQLYQSFGTCWQIPLGDGRQQCARDVIGLSSWADEKNKCFMLMSKSHSKYWKESEDCKEELKEKVEHLILFNLYELEVEAEAALTSGKATIEAVANFDVLIEDKKAQLEKSKSIQDWRRIIVEAKMEWKKFKANLL
ncbi:MAG: hypothetical protein A2983_00155 [Candidatus Magasanikbacteria bacterium RIFCSPLOWO2_01_FULL_40_15]|uniref:Uncharacterized protein n=1 Tax=Candidatus Magasanikbacteria bacterium RIFCSPLOWO2_01_FULL_40_15 TaxID=1798686 RepID=A0A1F6N3N8_9BACT|nr:MAG: hypothetical protein A3C66_00210 [Candidatus Magasanikbacteria bacterium RIFCSPHIGHO2_02_FULL_41_35]OGH78368.1 MAG: hypothetical protein A2983_00155 [Candidatus Magasanikbacteria bacterium RIFCSPLOWO2_01_FULL_40_15]